MSPIWRPISLGDRVLIGKCSDTSLHGKRGTVVSIRKGARVHIDHPPKDFCWGVDAPSTQVPHYDRLLLRRVPGP